MLLSLAGIMTEPQQEPLTAEGVRAEVRTTMMAQQTELLEIAGRNALKLLIRMIGTEEKIDENVSIYAHELRMR